MSTDLQGLAARGSAGIDVGTIMALTSAKEPMLRTPGVFRPGDDLYYTKENSMVQLPETRVKTGTDEISAQNKYWGSQSSFILPADKFVYGPIFAEFVLPEGTVENYNNVSETNICGVPAGWGFNCIESIEYTLGRTSSTSVSLSGYSNYMAAMLFSPNQETRNIIMASAGKTFIPNPTLYLNTSWGVYQRSRNSRSAIVPIHLPFSVIKQKIPFDTSTLDTPIKVTIRTKKKVDWWFGNAQNVIGRQFEEFNLIYKSMELSNKSIGLGELVKKNSLGRWLGYPYQLHTEDEITKKVALKNPSNSAKPNTYSVDLKNFINGDLTAIAIMFIRDIDHGTSLDPSRLVFERGNTTNAVTWGATNQLRKQSCYGIPVQNLKIYLNNNRLAVYNLENANEMFNTAIYDGGFMGTNTPMLKNVINSTKLGSATNKALTAADIVFGKDTVAPRSHVYCHFFTPKNPLEDEGEMQNVLRFPQNQMKLEFTIPQELGIGTSNLSSAGYGTYKMRFPANVPANSTNEETLHIKVFQLYNGVWTVEGGATKLYT